MSSVYMSRPLLKGERSILVVGHVVDVWWFSAGIEDLLLW